MSSNKHRVSIYITVLLHLILLFISFTCTSSKLEIRSSSHSMNWTTRVQLASCTSVRKKPTNVYHGDHKGLEFPRLAMWWPNSWNHSVDDLRKYHYIGWGDGEDKDTLDRLKQLNPDQLHFMSVNLTEVSWNDWGGKPGMYEVPAVWFLTQVAGFLPRCDNLAVKSE